MAANTSYSFRSQGESSGRLLSTSSKRDLSLGHGCLVSRHSRRRDIMRRSFGAVLGLFVVWLTVSNGNFNGSRVGGQGIVDTSYADNVFAIVSTIPVGDTPQAVAVDSDIHTVYVVNKGANTVSILDGTSNQVISTVSVGHQPSGLAVDQSNHRVYIANAADDTLSVVDGASNRIVDTIPLGHTPDLVSVDSTSHLVAVSTHYVDTNGNSLSEIQTVDGITDHLVASIPVGLSPVDATFRGVADLAFDTSTHQLYIGSNRKYISNIFLTDPSGSQVLSGVLTPEKVGRVAIDSDRKSVV